MRPRHRSPPLRWARLGDRASADHERRRRAQQRERRTMKEKTPVKARHSTRGVAATLTLITAALLSACGTAGTAAVVNGHTISERDAQLAAQQINEAFHPETPLTTADAVSALITAPFILDVANRIGHPQTPSA